MILNVAGGFYSAAVYDLWTFYFIPLFLEGGFCVIFLLMMISQNLDTYKLRTAVFLYYLIALTIVPVVITLLGVFGVGWDLVNKICTEAIE